MSAVAPRSGPGRTVITARAIQAVVRAVAAGELGAGTRAVSVDLTDEGGRLDVAVSTPVQVISIARAQAEPAAVARSGGGLLERAGRAESVIADRVHALTGRTTGAVRLRFTDAEIRRERRVR